MKNINISPIALNLFYIMLCTTKAFGHDFDQWKKNGIYIYPQARAYLTLFMKTRGLKDGHLYYLERPREAGWEEIKEKDSKETYEKHLKIFFTPKGRNNHFKKNFEVRERTDDSQLRGLYAKRDLPKYFAVGILNGLIMDYSATYEVTPPISGKQIPEFSIGFDYARFLYLQSQLENKYPSYAKISKHLGGYHAAIEIDTTWHCIGSKSRIQITPRVAISPLPGFLAPACLVNNFYGPEENYDEHLKRINVEAIRLWHPPKPPVILLFTSKKVPSKTELLWDYGGSDYWSNYKEKAENADTLIDSFLQLKQFQEQQKASRTCYESLSESDLGVLDDQVFIDPSPE